MHNDRELKDNPKPNTGAGCLRQRLKSSQKYAHRRDLVNALLAGGGEYSTDELDKLIKSYDEAEI